MYSPFPLASLGLIATTNPGGASKGKSKWLPEFSESPRGRNVVILPDNDEPGRKHAEAVAFSLQGKANSIKVVILDGLPAKGDVSDWLNAGGTVEQLEALVNGTVEWIAEDVQAATTIEHAESIDFGMQDPGPFPAELLDVGGFLGAVSQFSVETAFSPQPVLALAAALPLLGTLTGRKVMDAYGSRTNIFCLGVGESGCGKDRAREVSKEILVQAGLDKMIGPEGFASHVGIVNAVEAEPVTLFQFDEIGRLLKTTGDSRQSHLYHVPTVLMRLFSNSRGTYVGDAYADKKKNITIRQPHACIYGTTVPQSFLEGLSAESVSDGFLSRFIVFESADPDPEPQNPLSVDVPKQIIDVARYWGELRMPGDLNPRPMVVEYTPEATAIFDALQALARIERRQCPKPYDTLWSRTVEKARKLALIFAASIDHLHPVITGPAAAWAARLSEYLTRRMIHLANRWVSENQQESHVKRLQRLIESHGQIEKSDLTRATQWLSRRDRDEIIATLIESGSIVVEQVEGTTKSRTVYRSWASSPRETCLQ